MPHSHTTTSPIEGLRADHEAVLAVARSLSADEWVAESGCPGWTVQDLVAHLATLFWVAADPARLPDLADLPTEQAQDELVATRRGWTAEQVLADYEDAGARALEVAEVLVASPDLVLPLGDLGTYDGPTLVTAYNFDHYTHLRADLLGPRGPIDRDAPPSDEIRLAPVISWIMAALPQQCSTLLAVLPAPVVLDLTGPAGGRHRLDSAGVTALADGDLGPAVATIRCPTAALPWWVTGRATWEELGVEASGDPEALAAVREHVHVF